jgi:hypothetical protein
MLFLNSKYTGSMQHLNNRQQKKQKNKNNIYIYKFIVPAVFKDKFLQNTTSIMFFTPVILLDGIFQREQEPGSLFTQLSTSENIHQ